ncbi:hypothetical protein [Sphingomonas aerophila]|uniref:Uncharacterized protein n=1 Tax=Sphingomonas aerophila TaxID=1344948 RepID=A0A7W9EUP7_9SPHN|nr:hypothetical protein [Sphingomonas aerophila]MBB5715416.1 hypothetical protein [Sphingomonas aerophila]
MARSSTPRQAPKKRKAAELIVSLDEFASICGVTPETMRKHLAQAPADAPWLIERGRRGVGYKIAAGGAVAWWRTRSAGGGEDDAKLAAIAELRMQMRWLQCSLTTEHWSTPGGRADRAQLRQASRPAAASARRAPRPPLR